MIEPVGYFDMLTLEENARLIATDSGGVQREAYYMEIPCLTLRDETEWGATVETGWNKLVGANQKMILDNWFNFVPPVDHLPIYGAGNAADCIAVILNDPAVWGRERKNILKNNLNLQVGVVSK
jgi:UDP-GlcNAc3NAcA epimerase